MVKCKKCKEDLTDSERRDGRLLGFCARCFADEIGELVENYSPVPCEGCDGNLCLTELGVQCSGYE